MKKVIIVLLLILYGNIELFAKFLGACKGCHGVNFEKKAFGKSKIVKEMSKQEIIRALKGYKDGSYGGSMRAIMKVQLISFSNQDIKETAVEITGEIDTHIEPIHSTSQSKQKSLQVKKIEKQLSILDLEIQNLETENHLFQSQIDVKRKKIVSLYEETNYQVDTYLTKISEYHKKEIIENISMQSKIESYKQKAQIYREHTKKEVSKIEKDIEELESKLKINKKKLKRYRTNRDEKVKLLDYYNSTE